MSHQFILDLFDRLDFMRDQFFNAALQGPGIRTQLLILLGITTKNELPSIERLTAGLVGTFRNDITLSVTKSGLVEITTQHFNSERATDLANDVVKKY